MCVCVCGKAGLFAGIRTTSLPGSQPLLIACPQGLRDRHGPSGHVHATPLRYRSGAVMHGGSPEVQNRPPRKPTATDTQVGWRTMTPDRRWMASPFGPIGDHPMGLTCSCTAPRRARIHLKAPREYHVRGGRITGDSHRGYRHATNHPQQPHVQEPSKGLAGRSIAYCTRHPPARPARSLRRAHQQFGLGVDQPAGKHRLAA